MPEITVNKDETNKGKEEKIDWAPTVHQTLGLGTLQMLSQSS